MKQPFTCYLCSRAGRQTLAPRYGPRSRICQDCADHLAATGRAWCPTRLHVVPAVDMKHSECAACNIVRCRAKQAQPPDGYIPLAALVARLCYSRRTLGVRIARGWLAGSVWRRGPGCPWYVEDRPVYPAWTDERRGPGRKRGAK